MPCSGSSLISIDKHYQYSCEEGTAATLIDDSEALGDDGNVLAINEDNDEETGMGVVERMRMLLEMVRVITRQITKMRR